MSGFSPIGNNVPRPGISGLGISMSDAERREYQSIIDGSRGRSCVKVNKVKVEIFDLSDQKERRRYEKLWKALLEKVARSEAVVESSKDLVRRPDGTSYWMKYVEYVEFSGSPSGSVS